MHFVRETATQVSLSMLMRQWFSCNPYKKHYPGAKPNLPLGGNHWPGSHILLIGVTFECINDLWVQNIFNQTVFLGGQYCLRNTLKWATQLHTPNAWIFGFLVVFLFSFPVISKAYVHSALKDAQDPLSRWASILAGVSFSLLLAYPVLCSRDSGSILKLSAE